MNKTLAFFIGFIFVMLPVASAGIIYDEETMEISEIAGKWLNTWQAEPDSNWTADPVQLDGQNLYFGDVNVGTNYAKQMTMSDDGAFGAINYAQTGPHSEINTYTLPGVNKMGQSYGKENLAMSDDGNYIIASDEGRTDGKNPHVYFFGADEGPIWTYETDHSTSDVEDVDISNDGEYATACSSGSDGDNYLLFERENNTRIYNGSFPTGDGCFSTSISGDGTMVVWVQASSPYEAIVYDIINREVAWTHTLPILPYDVDISGDGERIAFGLDGGAFDEVQVFDTSDGTALWSVDVGDDVRLLVWNHDHTRLAINDKAGHKWLFDGSGTEIWKTVAGESGRAFSMSNDGTVIVSLNSEPDSLQVYNDISATPIMHNLLDEMPSGSGMEVDVSGDGKHIMAYDAEETMYIFTDSEGDGWSEEDNEPIWSKIPDGYDIETVISSGGTFAWANEDSNPATLNYGKIPLFSNSYNHDTPIYDEMWVADDYAADYEAIGDLTGLWLMDEATGTVVADSSSNGNDGTLNAATWTTGQLGAGVALDGTGGYVDVCDLTDSGCAPTDGEGSISIWVYTPDGFPTSGTPCIVCYYDTNVDGLQLKFYSNFGLQKIQLFIEHDPHQNFVDCNVGTGECTWLEGWNHLVGTWKDGESMELYLNGDEVGSLGGSHDTTPAGCCVYGDLMLGNENGATYSSGLVVFDELAIYNKELDITDVSDLYTMSHDRFEVGLQGHWRMEEGTGSTVADLSGNGNDGTIASASWDTGYLGNGLDFDGVNDYINVGGEGTNTIDFSPDSGTVALWYMDNDCSNSDWPVNNRGMNQATTEWFQFYINSSCKLEPYIKDGNGDFNSLTSSVALNEGQWHHIALTWSPDGMDIYIDGTSVGTLSATIEPWDALSENNLEIGKVTKYADYVDGKIDEVQIWSRDLSASEITDLYNFQYHGNPSAFDSAQEGKYVVSRTNSGEGGGGIALFDTHSGILATPKWTTDVGPGDLVSISDNVAPIVITGSTNGEVDLYDLGGTQLMSYTSDLEITGVAIMDDNSYAFASSADHYVYGWDLDPLSAVPAWSTFVDGAVIDMGFDDGTIAVVTKDYLIALNTAGVEQWREKLQKTPASVEFEAGRILIGYYTTDDKDNQFQQIEHDEDISMYYKPGVPVGLWTFDEGTGTTVEDRSGNGHTGDLNNGAQFTEGLIGGGVYLDGVNDEVDFGRFAELDGATELTVGGWFKFDSSLTHDSRILWKDDAFGLYGAADAVGGGDACRAYVYYDSGDSNAQGDCGAGDVIHYSTDNWIQLMMTYDGTTIRAYRDGIEFATQALADKEVRINDNHLMINGAFDQFEGIADEIAIYRTDLSALEIEQLYEDTKGRVYDVEDGLVGYWPLDGGADDYSSNGNDGTVTGATPGEGHVGGAYEFSGADEITVSDNLDELTTSDEFTVQAWFNAPAGSGYRWIVSRGTSWGDGNLGIYLHGDGTIQASAHDVSSAQTISSTTNSWDDGSWHHVVYSYDGNKAKLYVDGRLDVSGVSVGDDILSHSTAEIKIGDRSGSNFIGNIDEVAIWDRSLDDNEIKQIFYKSQVQFQSGLIAYYPISCGSCSWASDESLYYNYQNDVNKMTFSGGVSAGDDGKINDGLSFDGVDDYGEITDTSDYFGSKSAMTWNIWVNPTAGGSSVILDKTGVFRFYLNPTGTFYGYIWLETSGENGGYGNCAVTSPFGLDSWQMLSVTYDSSDTSLRYYYDGSEFYSCDLSTGTGTAVAGETLATTTNPVCIGSQECYAVAGNFYTGDLDELGFWSRALSIEELGELYNSRTHIDIYKNSVGWTLHAATGEKITDGFQELHTGGMISEDGTIATFRDEDLTDDAIDRVYLYNSTSNTATNFNGMDGTTIQFGDLTESATVPLSASTWVKYGIEDKAEHIMGKDGSWGCYIDSSDRVRCDITGLTLSGTLRGGAGLATDGEWHNVIFTLSATSAEIFIDGVSVSTMSVTGGSLANSGGNFYIGDSSIWGGPAWEGQISDTRLYTEILTADDIASLASSNHRLNGNYASTIAVAKGWWKLNEDWTGGATTADDSSINNYDSTNIVGTLSTYYNNMQSRYAVLDGVDDHINLDYSPSINKGVSFSVWFKEEDFTAQTGILSRRYAEDGLAVWNACDQWSFRLEIETVNNAIYTTGNCDGDWHNFIGTWDGTTMRTYVDGTFQDEITTTCTTCELTNDGFTFNIGRDQYSPNYFGGSMADVRIYDTAISEADISAIAGTNPAIAGKYAETFSTPVGWWKLNGNSDDSSSNYNEGTENGGLVYQHADIEEIGYTEGKGIDYTGVPEIRDVTFGNGGSTMVLGEGRYSYPGIGGRVSYYDSLGNGWQDTDFECYDCESFHIRTSGITTVVMEDNRNLVWGTTYGNTEFKSPGLHPTTANVIAFWQLQAGDGRPVYTKVVPQLAHNGTFWAGAMAISLEGDLWVESKYDGEGGQQYFVLYKYDKLGNLQATLSQEEYPFMAKKLFNPDSRSSIDIATNGSVLLSIDNNFIFINTEDTPKLLSIEGNAFTGPGQVRFLGDTGLIALSGDKGDGNEYAVYNIETSTVVWQFNSDVTAFQIDSSDNGEYIIFTNGTQMLFKAPTNNTLFTKAISGVKGAAVANNGLVAVASSVNGWFVYDKVGNLLLSGGEGQRVYDIDLDHNGNWMTVSGYDPEEGVAWMEVWALEEDKPFYEKYKKAFRTEKESDAGELRSYRVMMGEGSVQVLWGWAGPGGAGAELYTFEYGITLIEVLQANINFAFSTIILIAIVVALIGFLRKMIKGSGISG